MTQAPRPNADNYGTTSSPSGTIGITTPGGTKLKKRGISPSKKNYSPRKQHKIDFVSLNKKDVVAYRPKPTTAEKPRN